MHPTPPRSVAVLVAAIFAQMLPATLLAPAIRPLFALRYPGHEGAMHAFMAVNMAGATVAAPWVGRYLDQRRSARPLLVVLCTVDAVLLLGLSQGMPVGLLLALRALEGAMHVGAATLLIASASTVARAQGNGRVMGMAGSALMLAIACGSALGGVLVERNVALPFQVGALLCATVAVLASAGGLELPRDGAPASREVGWKALLRQEPGLIAPVVAALVTRFTVGALVVTFALFAHRSHALSDAEIGGLYALLTLPFALATYPMARLADRFPPAVVMALGFVVYGACLHGLGRVPTGGLPWAMLGAGLASAAIFAPILVYAAALGGRHRATVMSMVNAAGCFGMLLGPAAAGLLSHYVGQARDPVAGYRAVFAMAGLACAVWLLGSARWLVRRARHEARGRDVAAVLFRESQAVASPHPVTPSLIPPPQTGG